MWTALAPLVLPLLLSLLSPTTAPGAARCQSSDPPARCLERWLYEFSRGRFALTNTLQQTSDSVVERVYGDLVSASDIRSDTHSGGLRILLDAAVEAQSPAMVRVLVRVGVCGLVDKEIPAAARPEVVRAAAISALGRFTDSTSLHTLMQIAKGEDEGWRGRFDPEHRAAAVRALAATEIPVARPLAERACTAELPAVRLAAAEALTAWASPHSLENLIAAVDREDNGRVLEQLLEGAHSILSRNLDKCDTALVRKTVHATARALGRADWQSDLAAVELLESFRNEASIEPLIQTLERFSATRDEVDQGRLSGILRHRVHEALESLTGARIPPNDAAAWRAFWDGAKTDFVLAQAPEKRKGSTSAGFFGIPIVGMRVVFVIDRSGSMAATDVASGGTETRFDLAREEVLRAAASLPPDAGFSVVVFSDTAKRWRSGFALPEESVIKNLRSYLNRAPVVGGTDIYSALDQAMSIRTPRFGRRYDSPVDEIFLLSDGLPSSGAVQDPHQIRAILRETNKHRRVRINTVFIGAGGGAEFMLDLAKDHDGQFVQL